MYALPLPYLPPLQRLAPLAHEPMTLLLDGCDAEGRGLEGYSYLYARPFEALEAPTPGPDPFAALRARLAELRLAADPRYPPFQGGAAGLLSYELGARLEGVAAEGPPPIADLLRVGLYDAVIAWDHAARRCWILSTGLPEPPGPRREARARARAEALRAVIEAPRATPHAPLVAEGPWRPSATPAEHRAAVQRVIDYIHAGDIFQANLSLSFEIQTSADPFELYAALQRINPAPASGFMRLRDDEAVISASPERFLEVDAAGRVRAEPIKGTRPRGASPEADARLLRALVESPKDAAENVMIVDLLRNDLSRVCAPGSVAVPALCAPHSFASVHHLISTITGQLRPGEDALSLLSACIPGGSITGAPKIRAMEIIAELEGEARGPYCGSLFHLGFDGRLDSNLLIRTLTYAAGRCVARAGGGIVADSDPDAEHQEALDKARRILDLFGGA